MRPRIERSAVVVLIGGLGLFAAVLVGFVVNRAVSVDEFQHLHNSWCVSVGLLPYRDFFEHHTPLLYVALAPLFRLTDDVVRILFAARAFMLAQTVGIIFLTYRIATRCFDRVSGLFAALLLMQMPLFPLHAVEVRPDIPLTLCWVGSLAVLCGAKASRRSLFVAGLLLGLGCLATPKALFPLTTFAAVFVLMGVTGRGSKGALEALRSLTIYGAGFCVPLAALVAYFLLHGALDPLVRWGVRYNFSVPAALHNVESLWGPSVSDNPLTPAYAAFWLICLVGAGDGIVHWCRNRQEAALSRRALIALCGLSLIAALVFLNPRPNGYNVLPILPLVCICGGGWLKRQILDGDVPSGKGISRDHGLRATATIWWPRVLALGAICACIVLPAYVVIVHGIASDREIGMTAFKRLPKMKMQLDLARTITSLTGPDDAVFDDANIEIERPNAYFFPTWGALMAHFHETGRFPPAGFDSIETSFRKTRCKVIVEANWGRFGRVMTPGTALRSFVDEHYVLANELLSPSWNEWLNGGAPRPFEWPPGIRVAGREFSATDLANGHIPEMDLLVTGRYLVTYRGYGVVQVLIDGEPAANEMYLQAGPHAVSSSGPVSSITVRLKLRGE